MSVRTRCVVFGFAVTWFSAKAGHTLLPHDMDQKKTADDPSEFDRRPWGSYTVLDRSDTYKVKKIEVLPGKRLSYQSHERRAEHWFVVSGIAKVTLNGHETLVKAGESIDIAVSDAHRVENPDQSQTLIFIEVQTGDYFGEDDIVRLEDDFGRG